MKVFQEADYHFSLLNDTSLFLGPGRPVTVRGGRKGRRGGRTRGFVNGIVEGPPAEILGTASLCVSEWQDDVLVLNGIVIVVVVVDVAVVGCRQRLGSKLFLEFSLQPGLFRVEPCVAQHGRLEAREHEARPITRDLLMRLLCRSIIAIGIAFIGIVVVIVLAFVGNLAHHRNQTQERPYVIVIVIEIFRVETGCLCLWLRNLVNGSFHKFCCCCCCCGGLRHRTLWNRFLGVVARMQQQQQGGFCVRFGGGRRRGRGWNDRRR